MAKATRRPFEFDGATKAKIAARQEYLCAACGKPLGDGNRGTLVNCHHVIPITAGTVALPNDFPFSHGRDRAAHFAWATQSMKARPSRWRSVALK